MGPWDCRSPILTLTWSGALGLQVSDLPHHLALLSIPLGLGFGEGVDHASIHRDADAQRGDGDRSVEGSRVVSVVQSKVGHLGFTLPVGG